MVGARHMLPTLPSAASTQAGGKAMPAERWAELVAAGRELKAALERSEAELEGLERELQREGQRLPNATHPAVPVGGEAAAVVLTQVGVPPEFGFAPADHVALAEGLDLVDFAAGSAVAGPKFYYLKREAALLELALVSHTMQALAARGYVPHVTPDLVRESVLDKCGFQPRADNTQVYSVAGTPLCLTGTAEVPLAGLHMDSLLDEAQLPIRLCAVGHAFRTEAGAAGVFLFGCVRGWVWMGGWMDGRVDGRAGGWVGWKGWKGFCYVCAHVWVRGLGRVLLLKRQENRRAVCGTQGRPESVPDGSDPSPGGAQAASPRTSMHSSPPASQPASPPKQNQHASPRHPHPAGSAGRGLYRVHQFTKVEAFVLCAPEDSEALHQELVNIEVELFSGLGLHFKVLDMPTRDLGAPAYRKIDIEAWMPGMARYGEISSASNCTDFQARRLNIRYRPTPPPPAAGAGDRGAKPPPSRFVHTLNATGCAVPRMLVAILENFQRQDGSVDIPPVLHPYMAGITRIMPRRVGPAS